MRIHEESLEIKTGTKIGVVDVTEEVLEVVKRSGIARGLVNLWCAHTTACLSVNEHDKALWNDLIATMTRLVPIDGAYRHRPNAHAHILGTLIKPELSIPLKEGEMRLGTWQSILLLELDGPRVRKIDVTVMGE